MAGTVESVSSLPRVKRYITTHDANGKSVYLDSPAQQYYALPDIGGFSRSYSVAAVPADLAEEKDMKAYLSKEGPTSWTTPSLVTPGGVNLIVVDLLPGASSDMHQTVSVDFSICVAGEIYRKPSRIGRCLGSDTDPS